MYPNPQDALPLPLRPNLEQYRKQAKELAKAGKSADPDALGAWAKGWVESLVRASNLKILGDMPVNIEHWMVQLHHFARLELEKKCTLAQAQFVIARAEGFQSWPKLAKHIEALQRGSSPVSRFEEAADAIITGDIVTLRHLLRENPELVKARSTREHRATLLHYVSANGVEGYRQKTPKNIVSIATLLLEADAEVDAICNVYEGDCTTLGLTATSTHPQRAGVQIELMDVLLNHGARTDLAGSAGGNHTLIFACLANGQPGAARHLMKLGAPLDLVSAAGLGRLDVVTRLLGTNARLSPSNREILNAFAYACGYGASNVVEFLLDHGIDVNAELKIHGKGHTALHVAAFHGHVPVVELLLRRGAQLDVIDKTWGTPPLRWALTGWEIDPTRDDQRYYDVVARMVKAGAEVKREWLADSSAEQSTSKKIHSDSRMQAALRGETKKE